MTTTTVAMGPTLKKRKAFPVAALRELAIISCSTKLVRLHYQLKNAGLNTRVGFMNRLREHGLVSDYLAVMTYEESDRPYRTRDDLVAFLTHGSPKLRELYTLLYQTCFCEGRKLLVVEDIPFCAKLYEDVSPQGLNLQKASSRSVTTIPAKRVNPQAQAENRILHADQLAAMVEILRMSPINSHDQFREARQTSHVRLEIATKGHLPDIKHELVLVLNESQAILREFRETPEAQTLLASVEATSAIALDIGETNGRSRHARTHSSSRATVEAIEEVSGTGGDDDDVDFRMLDPDYSLKAVKHEDVQEDED
ncbi:MAG: hypothetical protein Q9181_006325 [Wetmoreana brouardii]